MLDNVVVFAPHPPGQVEEHSLHHVGHWWAGLTPTGLEHLLLRNTLPHSRGGQYRSGESVGDERGAVSHARA